MHHHVSWLEHGHISSMLIITCMHVEEDLNLNFIYSSIRILNLDTPF